MQLDNSFESDLGEAVLDKIEQQIREEIAPDFESRVRARMQNYARRHSYNLGVLQDALEVDVERQDNEVRLVARFPDPALLFERGTADHEIEAKNADVLSFIWERRHDPPDWVKEEFEKEGDGWRVFLPSVEVSGLPEGRFIRDTLHEFRRRLEA